MVDLYIKRSETDSDMLELFSYYGGGPRMQCFLWAVVHSDILTEDTAMREALAESVGPIRCTLSMANGTEGE